MKRLWVWPLAAIGVTTVALLLLWGPEWMANQYRFTSTKDWAEQVSANRTALVNLLGGAAVALTIYFTYRNFKVAQDKSVTDLLSKGIEQLGSTDLVVRLGGIYSLARIARVSEADYFPVMQILTGYLRTRYKGQEIATSGETTSPGESKCPVEAQDILSIVGERYWEDQGNYALDLSYVNLSDAWVPDSDYRKMFFWYVRLHGWNFHGAKLNDTDFKGAILVGCDFTDADFTGANLEDAIVTKSVGLTAAQLSKANNVSKDLLGEVPAAPTS